mgnify:CR=1 FL=1
MKFFLDSANLDEIRTVAAGGLIDGLTTNPSLLARERVRREEFVPAACALVQGPVSVPVRSQEAEAIVHEGRSLAKLHDAVVVKIAPGGKSLEFSTFLGGNGPDSASDIALDRDGRPVICGSTKSSNFPMLKAYDPSLNGGADFFVARLDADGSKLLYSTYIGGSKDDYACGIHPNADGSLVLSGGSESSNFPVKNAFNRKNSGNRDAVLLKLSKDGKSLAFSTYYGGSGDDWIEAQSVDAKGCPYIVGCTYSSNLPVKDAFQSAYRGKGDVFLAKFAPSGGALVYATYFGGPGLDDVGDISVSANGAVTMAGHTDSNVFPLKNAWDTTRNGVTDVFVAQFE